MMAAMHSPLGFYSKSSEKANRKRVRFSRWARFPAEIC
jgi:hypothetical protein